MTASRIRGITVEIGGDTATSGMYGERNILAKIETKFRAVT